MFRKGQMVRLVRCPKHRSENTKEGEEWLIYSGPRKCHIMTTQGTIIKILPGCSLAPGTTLHGISGYSGIPEVKVERLYTMKDILNTCK